MQLLSPQQFLQPALQKLQEGSELRKSRHQTQILKEENIYREQRNSTNILQNLL